MAASTPATAATTVKATSEPTGTAKRSPSSLRAVVARAARKQADPDPEHRSDVQAVVLAYESGVVAPGGTSSE
jgi:hypothetical protein